VDKVHESTGANEQSNTNHVDTYAVRGAVTWAPQSNFTITPALYLQHRDQNNTDDFWMALSDPSSGTFRTATPERMKDDDQFYLPSLKLDLTLGNVELISDTSFFKRKEDVNGYSGTLYNLSYFQQLVDSDTDPDGRTCTGGICAADAGHEQPLLLPTGLNLPGYPDNYIS